MMFGRIIDQEIHLVCGKGSLELPPVPGMILNATLRLVPITVNDLGLNHALAFAAKQGLEAKRIFTDPNLLQSPI